MAISHTSTFSASPPAFPPQLHFPVFTSSLIDIQYK